MTYLAVFLLSLLGFALLLMAMARHQQDWLRRKLSPRISLRLRWGGCAALGLGFALAGFGLGWAYGAVAWCGWLSVGSALILTAQTNRDRILARLRR
jgi:hypothetical protein